MTKNEILDYLSKIYWDNDFKEKLEIAVAKYVVYQQDPDSYSCYNYKYYISKEDAENDFLSRDYVSSGRLCYCIISSLDDSDLYRCRRTIYSFSYFD